MDFHGPDASEYVNVAALNRAFLVRLRSSTAGAGLRRALPQPLREPVRALRDLQLERLATAPFLLLSVREADEGFWSDLVAQPREPELFAAHGIAADDLVTATLSFLWYLARRNPYALRMVCGAAPGWCRAVSDRPLLDLLQHASSATDVLVPRRAGDVAFWQRLLGPGVSSQPDIRAAAQLACLQSVLTSVPAPGRDALRAAACRSPALVRRVTGPKNRR
jgi:hypothetical protein